MEDLDRRLVLGLGLAASTLALPTGAAAQTYSPTEGKEVGPGVRMVELGKRESTLPAYKTLVLRDVVLQPGAKTPERDMPNDMLCHMTEGELSATQNGKTFTVKKGDVWACAKGVNTEGTQNKGDVVAIMRIIDLMTA
jgi:quercetin dioxygenase-like cupin family protein